MILRGGRTSGKLRGFLAHLAHLITVPIAVAAREQGRPAPVATEIPRLVALAVIGPRARDDLWGIPRNQHVAPPTRRRSLHRDVGQLVVIHRVRSALLRSRRALRRGDRRLFMANAMPYANAAFSGDCGLPRVRRPRLSDTRA